MPLRVMSLTADMVELCRRPEIDEGRHPELVGLSRENFAELENRVTAESLPGPLWIFAYGSLIWNRPFEPVETRRATAFGWHRSFCMELHNWRGSKAQPGLMMALDNGGTCNGLALRVDDADREKIVAALIEREIDAREDALSIRWLTVRTADGPVRALTFYAGPRGPGITRHLPLDKVAWTLARACGHMGPGSEYLYHTVRMLEEYGIHDRGLWRLQEMVATEIRGIHALEVS